MNQYNSYIFKNIKLKKKLLKIFMKQNNYYYMYIKKSDKIINIKKSTGINIDEKLKKR